MAASIIHVKDSDGNVKALVTASGDGTDSAPFVPAHDLSSILGVAPDVNSGNKSAGTQRVVLATDQPALSNAQPVAVKPQTSGGWSVYRNLDGQPAGANVKSSAGQLGGYLVSNNAASVRYVKIYDKATTPLSSDTPLLTLLIPANSAGHREFLAGIAFAAGIGLRVTTGVADADAGAPAANDVIVNLLYK